MTNDETAQGEGGRGAQRHLSTLSEPGLEPALVRLAQSFMHMAAASTIQFNQCLLYCSTIHSLNQWFGGLFGPVI